MIPDDHQQGFAQNHGRDRTPQAQSTPLVQDHNLFEGFRREVAPFSRKGERP
jgi:hypothetical protein